MIQPDATPGANASESLIASLRAELAASREQNALLLEHNTLLQKVVEQLTRENELLRQKVDALVRRVFGKKSEQMNDAQLQLALFGQSGADEEEASSATSTDQKNAGRKPGKKKERAKFKFPANAVVVEQTLVPPSVQAAPQEYRIIREERTELLDIQPQRFQKLVLIRPVYVRRSEPEAAPIIAALPILQEDSHASPRLVARILTGKYCDHLPLYRQEQIYAKRHGVWLPRQTMSRWVQMSADWLRLIADAIKDEIFATGYVQMDESPVKYLSPGHGQTKQGYLWLASVPNGSVSYQWKTGRSAEELRQVVPAGFSGRIQCDGYSAYDALARIHAHPVSLSGCMAHVRRKFYAALESAPRVAGWIIHQIGHLYKLESELRAARAGPALRSARRTAHSKPILKRLEKLMKRLLVKGRYLPQSLMGQALSYAMGQWESLQAYLEEGRVEIDNNLVENAVRPIALGRKNYLFFGDAEAGHSSAIIYTVIESARRHGLEPESYLAELLTALCSGLKTSEIQHWTPSGYARRKRQQATSKTANQRAAAA